MTYAAAILLLLGSLIGTAFTLNAFWPIRGSRRFLVPSFFASWLTMELAGHHLVWQLLATGVLIVFGALRHPIGWLGIAVSIPSWMGLLVLILQGRSSAAAMHAALSASVSD